MTKLTDPIFHDEEAARGHFETLRWPDGPICPHCGSIDNATELKGQSTRPGVYKCKDCRKPFTATIGTLYERSHIPLHKWLLATHLICSSKKGMSAHQLWRNLGFGSYRTAWFMAHRIREGMREARILGGIGGGGKDVEADETYIGGREKNRHASKRKNLGGGAVGKEPVLSLVERGGPVASYLLDRNSRSKSAACRAASVGGGGSLSHDGTQPKSALSSCGRTFGTTTGIVRKGLVKNAQTDFRRLIRPSTAYACMVDIRSSRKEFCAQSAHASTPL